MSELKVGPNRFVGLDVHKRYLVAAAVDLDGNEVMSPRRVLLTRLDTWVHQTLTVQDAVVLEMTTNSFRSTTICCPTSTLSPWSTHPTWP